MSATFPSSLTAAHYPLADSSSSLTPFSAQLDPLKPAPILPLDCRRVSPLEAILTHLPVTVANKRLAQD